MVKSLELRWSILYKREEKEKREVSTDLEKQGSVLQESGDVDKRGWS